jgi:uncharacterized membrane protein YcaP (DUF421 family)
MDAILRAAAVYIVLLILFRISGRRTLSEMTSFDFVLILVIGESTQQALLGEDFSLTHAFLVIITLLFIDIVLSILKVHMPVLDKWLEGVPTVIVADGKPLHRQLRKSRLSVEDVLEAARQVHGIDSLDQIKYAVLEISGGISIIPR